MSPYFDDDVESPLARRLRRRKIIFGWVVLAGLLASVGGGLIAQILN